MLGFSCINDANVFPATLYQERYGVNLDGNTVQVAIDVKSAYEDGVDPNIFYAQSHTDTRGRISPISSGWNFG